jgi:hypothetical protein
MEDVTNGVTEAVTVREAADRLGVTTDAIRQRIKRGTIAHDKGEDGLTYVYLTPSEGVTDTSADTGNPHEKEVTEALLRVYEDQVGFLRRELERKDTIIMSLTQRIPELEASPEPQESPVPDTEDRSRGEEREVMGGPSRSPSWWRRFFGFS